MSTETPGISADETYGSLVNYEKRRLPFPPTLPNGRRVFRISEFHFSSKTQRVINRGRNSTDDHPELAYFAPEHAGNGSDKSAELGKMLNGLIGAIRPAA